MLHFIATQAYSKTGIISPPHPQCLLPTALFHVSSFLPEQGFPRMHVLRRSSLFPQVGGIDDWLSPCLPPAQASLGF